MYAVILTGGKQYRVTAGDTIQVEKLAGAQGDTIKLEQIMALSGDKTVIGTPHVSGALVEAQVIEQGKGDKVLIFKKKRRHNYRRKNGHRQHLTTLFITGISLAGQSLAKAEPKTKKHTTVSAAPKAKSEKPTKEAAKPAAKKAPVAKKDTPAKKPAAKKAQQ